MPTVFPAGCRLRFRPGCRQAFVAGCRLARSVSCAERPFLLLASRFFGGLRTFSASCAAFCSWLVGGGGPCCRRRGALLSTVEGIVDHRRGNGAGKRFIFLISKIILIFEQSKMLLL